MTKPIRLSKHAAEYAAKRGFAETEVVQSIRDAEWGLADGGRYDCRMEFEYNAVWNGKVYKTKQLRPVFVEEEREIVVVTVYTYYY